ncbi:MAG: hypothetical protein QRY74_00870 [Chlamydia sp.]
MSQNPQAIFSIQIGVDIAGSEVSERQLAEELQLNLEKISAPFLIRIYYTDSVVPSLFKDSSISSRISYVYRPTAITMDDIPKSAIRAKRDSTLFALLDDHVQGITQACITSTNTGALVLAAAHILGRMPAVQKTPLIAEIPFAQRVIPAVLLDSGAYPKASTNDLISYAALGVLYSRAIGVKGRPKVAFLNIGSEAMKGTQSIKEAYNILSQTSSDLFLFQGNSEPSDLFLEDSPDVILTSGFTGNIFLKTAEALFQNFGRAFPSIAIRKAAFLGGANGLVYKCHGKASGDSLMTTLLQAYEAIELNLFSYFKK